MIDYYKKIILEKMQELTDSQIMLLYYIIENME